MYYQNYDDYMRDVFYYNQIPNPNFSYPYNMYNMPNANSNQNLNSMYPSIYRIVQPVVSRVVTGNNYGYVNEDNLNSIVDTVFNIVESDVMENAAISDDGNISSTSNQRTNSVNQNSNNNPNTNNNPATSSTNTSRNSDNNQNSKNLLKDLIKILVIKEIINRNNIRRFNNNSYNNFQNYQIPYDQRYMF